MKKINFNYLFYRVNYYQVHLEHYAPLFRFVCVFRSQSNMVMNITLINIIGVKLETVIEECE